MGSRERNVSPYQVVERRAAHLGELLDTHPDAVKIVDGFISYFGERAARQESKMGVQVPSTEDPSSVSIHAKVDGLSHQIFSAHRSAGIPNPDRATAGTLEQVARRFR